MAGRRLASGLALLAALLPAACKPPAVDGYVERTELAQIGPFASTPLPSPDTEGALWAESDRPGRIIYGFPGQTPMASLECTRGAVRLTRIAPADAHAQAIAALIGNSHILRLAVDAVPSGRASVWQGSVAATDPGLEALTGAGPVELTVPGAGTLGLNPSPLPGELVTGCRPPAQALPPAPPASRP